MNVVSKQRKRDIQIMRESIESNGRSDSMGVPKKNWRYEDIKWHVKPITPLHEDTFRAFFESDYKSLAITGQAGTGKTLIGTYLALNELLRKDSPIDTFIIVRSIVQTRDMGFLPGDLDEKMEPYEAPYRDIFHKIFERPTAYNHMKNSKNGGAVVFVPTSFVRGVTWDNSIILLDETQNMTMHEIDSVLTRVGENSRVIMVGDREGQDDLKSKREVSGFDRAFEIAKTMGEFSTFEYGDAECVRSGFVRSWGIAKRQFQ